jgi:alpha-D-ribose 1-methylphosphonate 5-triphosphate diphosphatase
MLVLPGIVDLHGDAFEKMILPRSGAQIPLDIALGEADRQIVANGITTAYFGLSCTWEPGLRSLEGATAFIEAFPAITERMSCDAKLHLRFELAAGDAVDSAIQWIEEGLVDLLAFNNHVPYMAGRLDSAEAVAACSERSGLSVDEFRRLFKKVVSRKSRLPATARSLAVAARAHGVPMASHDDETPEARRFYREIGATICEFPCNEETAAAALADGDPVVLGAPNALKGGSLYERLDARHAVRHGICTVLSSDYYYPAPLHAAFLFSREEGLDLADAWNLVSRDPARALGLDDRGEIAPGQRADLVFVDDADPAHPVVRQVVCGGRIVYADQAVPCWCRVMAEGLDELAAA